MLDAPRRSRETFRRACEGSGVVAGACLVPASHASPAAERLRYEDLIRALDLAVRERRAPVYAEHTLRWCPGSEHYQRFIGADRVPERAQLISLLARCAPANVAMGRVVREAIRRAAMSARPTLVQCLLDGTRAA